MREDLTDDMFQRRDEMSRNCLKNSFSKMRPSTSSSVQIQTVYLNKRRKDLHGLLNIINSVKWSIFIACCFHVLPSIEGQGEISGWERPNGMPNIVKLEVMCSTQHMEVHLLFDSPFHGIVASKGMYGQEGCVYVAPRSGQKHFIFNIYYDKCGTKPDNQGKFYENTVVIQYDEELIEAWDEAKRLRCEWFNDYEKTATKTSPMVISDLDIIELNFHGDNVDCWMEIQEGKGPWASPLNGIVPLGSPLTMVVAVKDPTGEFDMRVKACEASDGQGGHVLPLSDVDGCILRPKLLGKFSKVKLDDGRATVLTYAYISAFKFPDMLNVHLRCTVEICRYGCPDHCSNKYGAIPPGHQASNNLNQVYTGKGQPQQQFIEPMAYESKQHEKVVSPNDISENENRPKDEESNPADLAGLKQILQELPSSIPGEVLSGPPMKPEGNQQPPQVQNGQGPAPPPQLVFPNPRHPPQPQPINFNRPGISGRPPPHLNPTRPVPGPGPQMLPPPQQRPAPHHFPPMPHHLVPPNHLNFRYPPQGPGPQRPPNMQQQRPFPPQHHQQPPIFVQHGKPNGPHHPGLAQSLVPPPPPQGVKEEKVNPRHNLSGENVGSGEESRNLRNHKNLSSESMKADRIGEAEPDNAPEDLPNPENLASAFPKGPRHLRVRRSTSGPSDVIGVQGTFRVVSQADLDFALNSTTENTPPTVVLKGRMSLPVQDIYGICLPRVGFGVMFFGLGLATLVAILIAAFLAYAHYKSILYNKQRAACNEPQYHIPMQIFPMVILRKMW